MFVPRLHKSPAPPLASLDVADTVVSDMNLAAEHRTMLEAAGVDVVLV